jgi:hypothetical protein
LAVTPQNNEAFLREVDEELRRDQAIAFWKRFGRWIAVGIAVFLAAFGGFLLWQHHGQSVAGDQGEQLQKAFDSLGENKEAAAKPELDALAGSKIGGYRAMAQFTQADLLLQKNDLKGAAAKFAAIAADQSLAQPFRDLALVRQTSAEYDTLQPQAVIDRLRGLAAKGNPWFGSAGEMVAVAYLRMGRKDMAGKLYGEIGSDDTVPASLRQRAVQMAGVLGVDAVKQTEEKKAQ